jgi:N-acetylglucosaminyldiphosphoundecaprenol N-acetyl-beta-D-mannosaminyltransferase
VHGILEARRDPIVARAFADATIAVPDGTPTVWVGWLQKHSGMGHVTGPALMREIFKRDEFARYTHFFYGGKEGVAEELAANMFRQFPWTRIVGTYTPPFRELTLAEEMELIKAIKLRKPDIIWVGISTPKQELFMRRMLPLLQTRLMFGVGAAFDFHTGRIRDCPAWIKTAGFQWLHRLLQDPKRLWRRNLSNAGFLWHIALQLTGLKKYPLPPRPAMPISESSLPANRPFDLREFPTSSSVSRLVLDPAHKAGRICSDD